MQPHIMLISIALLMWSASEVLQSVAATQSGMLLFLDFFIFFEVILSRKLFFFSYNIKHNPKIRILKPKIRITQEKRVRNVSILLQNHKIIRPTSYNIYKMIYISWQTMISS